MTTTVFITVDTEEDNWGDYHSRALATTNAREIPRLQALAEAFGAVPTYLVDYPMVTMEPGRGVLREMAAASCDIGAHCHPWNTPPMREELGSRSSKLVNLPAEVVREKLRTLHAGIVDNLGVVPRTFRAGRWGFGPAVAATLVELGYTVDSSVSPFVDWSGSAGPDYRMAPFRPYRFRPEAPLVPARDGGLLQVPASVGFFQRDQVRMHRIREVLRRPFLQRLRMVGALDRLGLLNFRWLSPETATGPEMVRLARGLVRAGVPSLNLTLHSSTLTPGLTPFVRSRADQEETFRRIETFLDFARGEGMRFAGLGAAPELLDPLLTLPEG